MLVRWEPEGPTFYLSEKKVLAYASGRSRTRRSHGGLDRVVQKAAYRRFQSMPLRQGLWVRPWTVVLAMVLLGGGLIGMTALLWNKMATDPQALHSEQISAHANTSQSVALSAVADLNAVPELKDPPAEAVFQIPGQDPMSPAVESSGKSALGAVAMASTETTADMYRMDPLEPVFGVGGPVLGGSLGDGTSDGVNVPKIDPVDMMRFTGLVDGRAGKKVAVLKVDEEDGPKTFVKRLGDTFTVGSSQVKLLKVNGYELSLLVNGATRRLMLEPLIENSSSTSRKSIASSSTGSETKNAPTPLEKEKAEADLMKGLAE